MASAIGCSEARSTAATRASTSARAKPSSTTRSVSCGLPTVSVPVLSTATTAASRSSCSASPLRNSTPICAARPVATMIEVGVASPIAHGQATISTATAFTSAKLSTGTSAGSQAAPNSSQARKASAASPITTGTKTMVTLSTLAWIGSLAPCAASTMRMICASTVSAPTRVARKAKAPRVLSVPPTTVAPARFSTGTGSPVIIDSSTNEAPSTTSPSTATFSPGRTSTTSPTATSAIGNSTTSAPVGPPRRTRAVRGWMRIKRRIASLVLPRARASSRRPIRISVMITAAASKYTLTVPAGSSPGANSATTE